jgi:hypothetical protein
VAYGNGLFVAVAFTGTGNRVMTSTDGITWTIRTSPADNNWYSVTYGNSAFVAVAYTGVGNRVMTSTDGITWTIRTSPADNNWRGVTYGNGLFVAVAFTGVEDRVMTAPDANLTIDTWYNQISNITNIWTIRTTPGNNALYSVTYGAGLFVAVAGTGTGNRVMTSTDGINWTLRTSAADNDWRCVAYGNGLFVAVAFTGTGNRVMTSPDGINWTIRTSAADNNWRGVAYGAGLFVAVAYTGVGNRVMTSTDGITWTIRTSAADNDWHGITYGAGLFVAVAGSGTGNRVMTSPDGINWTIRTSAADNNWRSVAYGNGLFVAVAYTGVGNRVMTSTDGITWTIRTSAADNDWHCVAYGDGLFVAVATTGTGDRVMTSPDGIAWTIRTSAADNNWISVAYGAGLFVAVAYTGVGNRVMTSPSNITGGVDVSQSDNNKRPTLYFNEIDGRAAIKTQNVNGYLVGKYKDSILPLTCIARVNVGSDTGVDRYILSRSVTSTRGNLYLSANTLKMNNGATLSMPITTGNATVSGMFSNTINTSIIRASGEAYTGNTGAEVLEENITLLNEGISKASGLTDAVSFIACYETNNVNISEIEAFFNIANTSTLSQIAINTFLDDNATYPEAYYTTKDISIPNVTETRWSEVKLKCKSSNSCSIELQYTTDGTTWISLGSKVTTTEWSYIQWNLNLTCINIKFKLIIGDGDFEGSIREYNVSPRYR